MRLYIWSHEQFRRNSLTSMYHLGGVVVGRPPREHEFTSSIPSLDIPKTLKIVTAAALLGAQCFAVSITTVRLMSG